MWVHPLHSCDVCRCFTKSTGTSLVTTIVIHHPYQMAQIAFCDLLHKPHKQPTTISMQFFVVIYWWRILNLTLLVFISVWLSGDCSFVVSSDLNVDLVVSIEDRWAIHRIWPLPETIYTSNKHQHIYDIENINLNLILKLICPE